MTWQNPWAWAGLVALALPVLIHLFSRRQARVAPFPTLRFLDASRLLPTRRTRVSDLLLLLVRLAILGAATAALAQPLWRTNARRRAESADLARAIVVDTSASLSRPTGNGTTAREAALQSAQRFADSASVSTIVLTAAPSHALPGVVSWLRQQRGRREVVVVSDFQPDVIDANALRVVPAEMGVVLSPILLTPDPPRADSSVMVEWPSGEGVLRARTTRTSALTTVEWTPTLAPADTSARTMFIRSGAREQPRALAVVRALLAVGGTLRVAASEPVVVLFPESPQRAEAARTAGAPTVTWMLDIAARLRTDRVLTQAARNATVLGDSLIGDAFLSLATTNAGRAVAVASRGSGAARADTLFVFAQVDAGSVAAAALLDALSRAANVREPVSELDHATIDGAALRAMERPPATVANGEGAPQGSANADVGDSDARWVWLLVLLLLGAESWMRRSTVNTQRVPVTDAAR